MASVVVLDSESDASMMTQEPFGIFTNPKTEAELERFGQLQGASEGDQMIQMDFQSFFRREYGLYLNHLDSTTKTLTTSTSKPYGLKSWLSHDIVALLYFPAMMETCHNRQLGVLRITPIYKPWSSPIWKGDHHR